MNNKIKKLTYEELLANRLTIEDAGTAKRFPISVLLDNVRSLYNVGTFFRTCDSAGVSELLLTGYTPHPPRIEIEKTALGAVDSVKWQYFKEPTDAIKYEKDLGHKIIAVELTNAGRRYDSLLVEEFPLCLVFGNELSGVSDAVLSLCDSAIEIPMFGVKHSLNVGVSAGIAIYEAVKVVQNSIMNR